MAHDWIRSYGETEIASLLSYQERFAAKFLP
jgi:hypothetical protein